MPVKALSTPDEAIATSTKPGPIEDNAPKSQSHGRAPFMRNMEKKLGFGMEAYRAAPRPGRAAAFSPWPTTAPKRKQFVRHPGLLLDEQPRSTPPDAWYLTLPAELAMEQGRLEIGKALLPPGSKALSLNVPGCSYFSTVSASAPCKIVATYDRWATNGPFSKRWPIYLW